jgi:hypothetical protein
VSTIHDRTISGAFGRRSRVVICSLAVACLNALLGCSDLTSVSAPDLVTPADLENAAGALTLDGGAVWQFSVAYSNQIVHTAFLTDEFSDLSAGASYPEDKRETVVNPNGIYPFDQLSKARIAALSAITALEKYDPSPADQIGKLFAFLAYADIFFAENMCSGVPVGVVHNGVPTYGPTLSHAALLQQALVELDSAGVYTSGSDSISNLVRVARGRALLDEGSYAAASTAVDSVPTGYLYQTIYSGSTSQTNGLWIAIETFGSVSDNEGINGLPFVSASDPRVVTQSTTNLSGVQVVMPQPAPTQSSPLMLASGFEARLIQAEAAYQAGQTSTWAATLNALRETAISPAIPDLPADSTTQASATLQVAVHFRERAFWLFLTGHRQGDMRRLIDQYGRPTESVYPTGPYQGGPQQYSNGTDFLPFGESGNPNFHGCSSFAP